MRKPELESTLTDLWGLAAHGAPAGETALALLGVIAAALVEALPDPPILTLRAGGSDFKPWDIPFPGGDA